MESRPVISVVMPARNAERFLPAALNSIRDQSFRDYEFIVINDGSQDATQRILEDYARSDSRIRLHHQGGRGMVPSLNTGCEMARGAYIARMDSDDIAHPKRFEKQVAFLERNPEIAVLGAAVMLVDENDKSLFPVAYPKTPAEVRRSLYSGTVCAHPVVMMRRGAFIRSGGYRKAFDPHAADYDLWLRMSEYCDLANLQEILLRYRFHEGGVSFRDLSQQVLAMVGAEQSAGLRRSGERDWLAQTSSVTLEDLLADAQRRDAIASRILQLSAARCGFLLRVGQVDEALELLQWAWGIGGSLAGGPSRARAGMMRALAWGQKGSVPETIKAAAQGFAADPVSFANGVLAGFALLVRSRLTPQLRHPADSATSPCVASSPTRIRNGML